MPEVVRYAGQAVFYLCAALLTGYLSIAPAYHPVDENLAQIKLSFAHGASRVEDCRKLTSEEIAALPANERRPNTCSRQRNPIYVQFAVDGKLVYEARLEPTGLSGDGPARTYEKFLVPAGTHEITARLRDTARKTGYDYEMARQVTLKHGQSLAIDFRADEGGFILR